MPARILVVLDGASDRPSDGETPLENASTPNLDKLASHGNLGSMYTVGQGIAPESDAGVFSLLGYDPLKIHLSRGVVETIGANVPFEAGDLALRAGFATVEGDKLVDRRAGRNLSTIEARELGDALNKHVRLKEYPFEFKSTVGHRAVLVFRKNSARFSSEISNFDPAYVRLGMISVAQPSKKEYDIPRCDPLDGSREAIVTAALVNEFGFKARHVLDKHPVNEARRRRGYKPANFVLMRDPGTERPMVESFQKKWNMRPVMVADLPAELGIGRVLGMDVHEVAPGTGQEDYHLRAQLVKKLLPDYDFLYVHLKGPDEPGHDGLFDLKRQRIEEIDNGFFSILHRDSIIGKARLCVTCDHSTPWKNKGHSDDPVPVLITNPDVESSKSNRFTERNGMAGSLGKLERGTMLLERF